MIGLSEPDYPELERRFAERFHNEFTGFCLARGKKVEPNSAAWRQERSLYVAEKTTTALDAVEQRWRAAVQAEATMRLQGLFQRVPSLAP